jgi:transposase
MKVRQGPCRDCERLGRRVAELEKQLAAALARIADLERQLASAKKDSSTSSKPPSSDIIKPPRPAAPSHVGRKRKRRCGGQPGHERHERTPFGPEAVDKTSIYEWPSSSLEGDWIPLEEFVTIQQVELAAKLFEVTEHRARRYRHRLTGEVIAAPLPEEVLRAGLVGPRLSALIAYEKGGCHMSYRVIETFLLDILHLPLSTGQLVKVVGKASAALASGYAQLQAALPGRAMLNVDETGHPDSGQRLWTWGFHAPDPQGFTLFHIDPSRSSEVLKEFLGETFRGVVGCDYHSAYRKFLHDLGATMQFCWSHLIRDVKYLVTLPDAVTRRFGEKLLEKIKHLFRAWHRRDQMPEKRWSREADRAQRAVLKVARRAPGRSEAQNIAERFRRHGEHYFRFLTMPGVEPTNNAMEQRFRFVVIDRKITQGTRGEAGRRWCERIWTVLATCAQQGRSAFDFLYDSIVAYFTKQPSPSLLPQPP